MGHYKYDRLSAQDTSFLIFENQNVNMHVFSTAIYDAGPLKTEEGGIDFPRIKKAIGDVLHRIPRYRQKLLWIQENKTAVWIDDPIFNLDYHVRHTSLPRPGNETQLKTLASRVSERQLDRAYPLWEIWVIEGLENDRFAMIHKIHHSLIDGSAGVELSQVIMSPDPDYVSPEPPQYFPRPTPTMAELRRDEYLRYAALPWKAVQSFRKENRETAEIVEDLKARATAIKETFAQFGTPSETPLNGKLGPHRIIDWMVMPLEEVKAVSRGLECTVNDVVLTIVTGAIRNFFLNRQMHPEDVEFRVAAPVSVRRENEANRMGNRVSAWSIRLPIEHADPLQQLAAVHKETQQLKDSKQAMGVEMMMALAEWTPSLLSLGARAGGASNNTIVTNIPGPQFPLYFIGAEMEKVLPCVPLMENMGLGIALFSYNGKLMWGFIADYGRISDIANFLSCVRQSFEALAAEAGVELSPSSEDISVAKPKAKRPPKRRRKKQTPAQDAKPTVEPSGTLPGIGETSDVRAINS